jgi:polysaccharide pyruvyl transferase WcaK-like protein
LARSLLRRADYVVLREERSLGTARSLGAQDAIVAPDIAFALEPALTPRVRRVLAAHELCPQRFAVVSLRRAPYDAQQTDEQLVAVLAQAVNGILARGLVDKVAIVVHTTGPTEVENDLTMSERLFAEVSRLVCATRLALVNEDLSPAEMAAFYGEAKFLIGERLHAVILALRAGTPSFAIAYFSDKTRGTMESCGFDDLWCEVADVRADRLVAVAERLARPEMRDEVRAKAASQLTRLNEIMA